MTEVRLLDYSFQHPTTDQIIASGAVGALPGLRGSELADLDGEGDLDLLAFGEQLRLCKDVVISAGQDIFLGVDLSAEFIGTEPTTPTIVTNDARASGLPWENRLLRSYIGVPNEWIRDCCSQ